MQVGDPRQVVVRGARAAVTDDHRCPLGGCLEVADDAVPGAVSAPLQVALHRRARLAQRPRVLAWARAMWMSVVCMRSRLPPRRPRAYAGCRRPPFELSANTVRVAAPPR